MRYSKEHKLQTRNRIVKNASHSLRQKGVDGVSVADLMKLAGLTHGGFYSHFDSREALVVESFALVIDQTASRWLDLTKGITAANRFDAIVKAYLSPRHRDNSGHGCALPAMGADIARSSEKVRGTFAKQLEKLIDVLACQLSGISTEQARQIATAAIATMMGSIVLARASSSKKLSDDILEAGLHAVHRQAAVRKSPGRTIQRQRRLLARD